MKHQLILFFIGFISLISPTRAEVLNPVKWSYTVEKAGEGFVNLQFKATIDKNWHLYSQHIPDGGPIPTSFQFTVSPSFELIGKPAELSKSVEVFDKSFSLNLRLFSQEAIFVQKIKVKTATSFTIKGTIEFMSCDDHQCLPPREEEFSFLIPASTVGAFNEKQIKPAPVHATEEQQQVIPSQIVQKTKPANTDSSKITNASTVGAVKSNLPSSLWQLFLIAFLAGIAGLATPCVYPMIPMTVSFFIRGEAKRSTGILKAFLFGFSIIFIYTMIGVLAALTGSGADVASILSTHWIPNLIFFLLFFVFAASFFGMFEIVLPSSLANKIDKQADKGGYIGVFFMALTLVVVSFSCTIPFVGGILIGASKGEFIQPVLGMFGYSLAFAIPFVFFAVFPSLMKNMAKSGSWLNVVKVVMAFLLLALSLKYLLAIDTTYHFDILSREIFLSIWIVIFSLLGFYLAGKLKFAHDGEVTHIGVPRLMLIIICFSFVVYMIPGLFGAPLKLLSSVLPSQGKEQFSLSGNASTPVIVSNLCETPRYEDFLHLPFGLKGYFDYEQGIACAQKLNKPVFIDLKGHTCSNCKVMETAVFADPQVLEKLSKDYVIIALYTDDKTNLPEKEWIKSAYDGKIKKTLGAKNLDFEISRFKTNTLPLYVILKPDGSFLIQSEFNTDKAAFLKFLTEGKKLSGI